MKKEPTEKQLAARKKFGEAARARAAAKKQAIEESLEASADGGSPAPEPKAAPGEVSTPETISVQDYQDLMNQIQELKNMQWQQMAGQQLGQPGFSLQGGKLTGSFEKYDLSPNKYPDPTERLFDEPRLAQFAPRINNDIKFNVAISEYTTIDGIRTKEPKFTLELIGKVPDEETGEYVPGAFYIIRRFIFHEDPEAALVIAREQGIDVDEENEEDFLNEMRYIRMRDLLVAAFYPPEKSKKKKTKDFVVGGKIVEYFEIDDYAENKARLPFEGLNKERML